MDMNILFHHDDVKEADDFPSLDPDGFLMMGDKEEMKE